MFSFQAMSKYAVYQKISEWYVVVRPPKIVINLSGPATSYNVKGNHIGSVVSEILWYRQKDTHRQTVILLLS